MKKASEEIKEIRSVLIAKDWTGGAGNKYSFDSWFKMNENNVDYWIKAILIFLDREEIKKEL